MHFIQWHYISIHTLQRHTVEVWEWISNLVPHFMMNAITYPCCNWSQIMLVKRAPGRNGEWHTWICSSWNPTRVAFTWSPVSHAQNLMTSSSWSAPSVTSCIMEMRRRRLWRQEPDVTYSKRSWRRGLISGTVHQRPVIAVIIQLTFTVVSQIQSWYDPLQFFLHIFTRAIIMTFSEGLERHYHRSFDACCAHKLHMLLLSWWRHQMEPISALLALCQRESTGYRWIPLTKVQ